jgi:Glycosyl hydrolase family 79, N-terminal domain
MLTNIKDWRRNIYPLLSALLLAGALATGLGGTAAASNAVQVTVNAQSSLGKIPETAFGLNTAVWDSHLLDPGLPSLLHQAGTTLLRFPGGSTSDVYHWQTNSITHGQGGYASPNNTFDAFMKVAQQTSAQTMLTVNYGSNAAGTAGGDPQEAADWVTYANITKHYGVRYWEIGNELYGNGTYGSHWEVDLHKTKGPAAYATNALTFIHAMKAVDPTIQTGIVLTAPGRWPDGVNPDWNRNVLSIACNEIDFVDVHWYPQDPGPESDAGLLNSTRQIASMVSTLRSRIKEYCGSHVSRVGIMVTETNSVSFNPGKQTVSPVNALFLADNYMNWLENGITNIDWWDIHNSITTGQNNSPSLYGDTQYGDYGILSSGQSANGISEPPLNTPFPTYYGLQMLTKLGGAGDHMLQASSSQPLLAVHAVKRQDGRLAILLINKDPSANYKVSFSLAGYSSISSAVLYSYGKSSNAIQETSDPAFGNTLSEDIPPYSLVTLVLTPGKLT